MTGEAIAGIIVAGGGVLTGVMEAYRRIAAGNTLRIIAAIADQTAKINELAVKNGSDRTALQDVCRSLKDVAVIQLRISERCETVESMRRRE